MNTIILRGRMTTNPEVKITGDENSITIARFSLAVTDRTHRNSEGGYDVDFIKIIAFNKHAQNIERFTEKGSELLITGRLHTYSYKNKNDQLIYMAEVVTEKVEFISNCKKSTDEFMEIPDDIDDELPFK